MRSCSAEFRWLCRRDSCHPPVLQHSLLRLVPSPAKLWICGRMGLELGWPGLKRGQFGGMWLYSLPCDPAEAHGWLSTSPCAGRIKDLVESGKLSLSSMKFFILDEADRLLDTGNQDLILNLFSRFPKAGTGTARLQVAGRSKACLCLSSKTVFKGLRPPINTTC